MFHKVLSNYLHRNHLGVFAKNKDDKAPFTESGSLGNFYKTLHHRLDSHLFCIRPIVIGHMMFYHIEHLLKFPKHEPFSRVVLPLYTTLQKSAIFPPLFTQNFKIPLHQEVSVDKRETLCTVKQNKTNPPPPKPSISVSSILVCV